MFLHQLPAHLTVAAAVAFITTSHHATEAFAPPQHSSIGTNTRSRSLPSTSSSSSSTAIFISENEVDAPPPKTYPIARKAMIDKIKQIDPSFAPPADETKTSSSAGSYSSVGWSNRLGTVLTPAAIGIYTACRPFYWNTIDVGCRMTVIELSTTSSSSAADDDNKHKPDLLIHSPVLLDRPLMDALEKIGTVKHVISPNYEHVKYAKMWGEIYPNAFMWACPGMMEREPQVRWTGELPYGCRPPSYIYEAGSSSSSSSSTTNNNANDMDPKSFMWDWNEVQPFHINVEKNPFTGKPFFNEVVFFHSSSKTLMTTDTYWNYPRDGITNSNYENLEDKDEDYGVWELAPEVEKVPLTSRLWKVGMDKLFRPFYLNLMVQKDKKEEFKTMAAYISGLNSSESNPPDPDWDVECVIPAHGDIVRGGVLIKKILRQHFNL